MRKLFWCGTALVTAGLAWTGFHTWRHPDSTVGQFVLAACETGARYSPLGLAGKHFAGTGTEAAPDTLTEEESADLHDEPKPCDDAPAPAPAVVPMAGTVDLAELKKAVLPAPIIIPEDEEPRQVSGLELAEDKGPAGDEQRPDAAIDLTGFQEPSIDQVGPAVQPEGCPKLMPFCLDEDVPVPAAETKANSQVLCAVHVGCLHFSLQWGSSKSKEANPATTESSADSEANELDGPKGQIDRHYHEQYPGCPFMGGGCPVKPPSHFYRSETEPTDPFPGPDELFPETKTTPKIKKHTTHKLPEQSLDRDNPFPLRIDTLEFRSSDRSLNEYGPGPI
jgi:hypothetical protein